MSTVIAMKDQEIRVSSCGWKVVTRCVQVVVWKQSTEICSSTRGSIFELNNTSTDTELNQVRLVY